MKSPVRGRFVVEKDDNWCLIDSVDGTLVGFNTKHEATAWGQFAREYVRRHGDIDLLSFPWDLNQPLHYDLDARPDFLKDRPWVVGTEFEKAWAKAHELW